MYTTVYTEGVHEIESKGFLRVVPFTTGIHVQYMTMQDARNRGDAPTRLRNMVLFVQKKVIDTQAFSQKLKVGHPRGSSL